jgi:hypothetical protein
MSSIENVNANEPGNGEQSTPTIVTNVNSNTREESQRIIERIEREMDIFRKGECSRFQASSRVANELDKWEGASEKEKGKAFDSYLVEINSYAAVQDEERSDTRETSPPQAPGASVIPGERQANGKRTRELEVEELLDQVSRGELEGEENEQ